MLKPSYYSLFNITLHNDYQHYTQKKTNQLFNKDTNIF